jgi:hypothetical protein
MSRYLLFLFVTTFLGCASKHNFAGKHFESSNSLCLDALIVNMEADGCKNMSAEQSEDEKLLKISCTDSKIDGNSAWLTHTFYFANTALADVIKMPGMPMCVDPNLSMTYSPIR